MRVLAVLCIVGGIGFVLGDAGQSPAQVMRRPPTVEMFSNLPGAQGNETGFTLGAILDRNLWVLARHPLAPETLSRVGDDVHRAPHRGVQFELLTPGDVGATVHFRW